ncbi:MAG: YlxR family protein [Lachnospiraceae bacterium]|nr:YlxR family protein [Lachnospiraceae bacterium]
MAKNVPARVCIGCLERKDKKELIRIVRVSEGIYEADVTGKKNGRGAYICKNAECLNLAFKKKGLERSFKESIPEEVVMKLKGEIESLG